MAEPIIEKTVEAFAKDITGVFGDDCVSIILYGSAATADFKKGKSDFNFMVVLTPAGLGRLRSARKLVGGWERKRILFPLFISEEWIRLSLDSFPIEFFNMKQTYRVVRGKDVFDGMEIPLRFLRLQCERELKGKLLHLRANCLLSRGRPKAIRTVIARSIVTYTAILRALLFVKGRRTSDSREEILTDACGEFHLDLALFRNLLAIREKGITYTKFELEDFMDRYIAEIDRLCRDVDQLTTV
ncbi:MAG: hypothetical protein QUS35_01800 [bacterium]|nr:hypothetical protein [bacterium]